MLFILSLNVLDQKWFLTIWIGYLLSICCHYSMHVFNLQEPSITPHFYFFKIVNYDLFSHPLSLSWPPQLLNLCPHLSNHRILIIQGLLLVNPHYHLLKQYYKLRIIYILVTYSPNAVHAIIFKMTSIIISLLSYVEGMAALGDN
jgi:hypothetical protein